MAVIFEEVIASVETPTDSPPPEAPPPKATPASPGPQEIVDAVETQQRRALRLQAD